MFFIPCMFCTAVACDYNSLVSHHKVVHSDQNSLSQCDICFDVFPSIAIPKHKALEHAQVKCNQCKKWFDRHTLSNHKVSEHSRKCQHCDMSFTSHHHLRNHLELKHGKIPKPDLKFNCENCKSSFSTEQSLTQHMRTEHSLICGNCNLAFVNDGELENHTKECSKYAVKNSLWCPFEKCNQRFDDYKLLKIHIFNMHKNTSRFWHQCRLCRVWMRTKRDLDLHLEYKVCQAECQVMSKYKDSTGDGDALGRNLMLEKVTEDHQNSASESDGEICVD